MATNMPVRLRTVARSLPGPAGAEGGLIARLDRGRGFDLRYGRCCLRWPDPYAGTGYRRPGWLAADVVQRVVQHPQKSTSVKVDRVYLDRLSTGQGRQALLAIPEASASWRCRREWE